MFLNQLPLQPGTSQFLGSSPDYCTYSFEFLANVQSLATVAMSNVLQVTDNGLFLLSFLFDYKLSYHQLRPILKVV